MLGGTGIAYTFSPDLAQIVILVLSTALLCALTIYVYCLEPAAARAKQRGVGRHRRLIRGGFPQLPESERKETSSGRQKVVSGDWRRGIYRLTHRRSIGQTRRQRPGVRQSDYRPSG